MQDIGYRVFIYLSFKGKTLLICLSMQAYVQYRMHDQVYI